MNIVFVGAFGLAPKSTMKVRALPLAKALARRGHRLTMVLPPWDNPPDSGATWEEEGVTIINVPLPAKVPFLWYGTLGLRVLQEVKAHQPDILHAFKPKGFSGLVAQATIVQRRGNVSPRVIVDTDDWEEAWNEREHYPWWMSRFFSYQEQWLMRRSDATTAASKALVALAAEARGAGAAAIYLPNGTTGSIPVPNPDEVASLRERLSIPEGPVLLLYTRFVECSPERELAALHAIAQRGVRPTVLLVGSSLNGEDARFITKAKESALPLPIIPVGWVDYQALPSYFALADAALFPIEDTLLNRAKCPARLVDMMSAGVAVAAEAVGQVKEYLIDGESGLLAAPGNLDDLADATVRLLQDSTLRAALGTKAQQRITTNFHWDQLAALAEEAYKA